MKTNSVDFLTDYLEDNTALEELFKILGESNDQMNLTQIQELLSIRNPESEQAFVESIRMLGVNLDREILSNRMSALRPALSQMPEWRKVNGTKDWNKYVTMLVGAPFRTQRLFTADYAQFFPTAMGTLIQDGGEWYRSTHVELEVDRTIIDSLDLTMQAKDIQAVKEALILIGKTEQQAITWAHEHVGLPIQNQTPVQAQARAVIVQQRISELFYEWSPIEEVLERIQATLNLGLYLHVTAHTVVESTRRFFVGKPVQESIKFLVPEFIHGGIWTQIGAQINYSDGTTETVSAHIESDAIVERDGESVRFTEPNAATTINITLSHAGASQSYDVRLFPLGITPDPDSLTVVVPTLYGSSSALVRVYGNYGSSRKDLTDSGLVFFEATFGVFQGNKITFPSAVQDTVIDIKVTYSGIQDIVHTVQATVKRSVLQRLPVSISLQVPDVVGQGQQVQLVSRVLYNNGDVETVFPQYSSTSKNTRIVEDVLMSNVVKDDYMTTIVAEFGSPEFVRDVKQVRVRSSKSILAAVDILLPDVRERMYITPRAQALYVKETATPQQIADRDPSIIVSYQPIIGTWFSSDVGAGISALPNVAALNGEFWAPSVDSATKYNISINVVNDGQVKTFTLVFDVLPMTYIPQQVDINHGRSISNGSVINLPTVCQFNTGQTFAAAASLTVEYLPSASAEEEARKRIIALQKQAIEDGEDPTQWDPDAPDYSLWVTLSISDGPSKLHDPMLNRDQRLKQLYFAGDLHGSARVHITYVFEGHTVTNYRDFQLVPVRSLVTDLSIESPLFLYERTRTFVRLLATYEDGTQGYVSGDYSGQWLPQDDDYELLQFVADDFTGLAIVTALDGRPPTSYEDFRSMPSSKLPVFQLIENLDQLRTQRFAGAIVQCGKLNEESTVSIIARHFRMETYFSIDLMVRPPQSINNFVSARIIGPQNIRADVNLVAYSLACVFRSNGIRKLVDGSYVNETPTECEVEMSADWTVLEQYIQETVNGVPTLIPTDQTIVELDNEGTISVAQNVNGAARLQAAYLCDAQNIVRNILVNVAKTNTYLTEALIIGQDIVHADMALNPDFQTDGTAWYIPYQLRVIFSIGEDVVTTDARWSIGMDTNMSVSIDEQLGHLYLPEGQVSDGQIRIDAEYSAEDPITGQPERIQGTRVITFRTQSTIVQMNVETPESNIEPNNQYQALAFYERRTGQTGSNEQPDADTVSFSWEAVETVSGFNISESGVFSFVPDTQPQTVTVRCTLTEQRTVISRDLVITCLGVGYPQDLSISSFENVRDNSVIKCDAWLGRSGTFGRENISQKCLWQIVNSRGDVVTVPSISISSDGTVTMGRIHSDTRFGVRSTYIEGKARLMVTRFINAFTSYPRFGTAAYGINTMALIEQELSSRLRAVQGGSFVFTPDSDEFGYFAVGASYGSAVFGFGADSSGNVNRGWTAMDGAKWPVTGDDGTTGPIIVQKSYDNLTEDVLLYRTNSRGFGVSVLTVRFS